MLLCYGNGTTPANGVNGMQLSNPFDPSALLGENDRTATQSTTAGASLQATNDDQLFGHNNHFVVGTSFDRSVTDFAATAELGTAAGAVAGHAGRIVQKAFRSIRPGGVRCTMAPISVGLVR